MELMKKRVDDLIPYENNPRLNDQAVDAVAESIRQCGYVAPIIVDEDGIILAGHTRRLALQRPGIADADVIVRAGLTEEQKRKYRILDNKTNEFAEWDFSKLEEELADLDFGDFDFGLDESAEKNYSPNQFGDSFQLPDGDKPEICQMTFTLNCKQKELIEYAMECVSDQVTETFGNTNKNGNALYEVVKQWAWQKKLR